MEGYLFTKSKTPLLDPINFKGLQDSTVFEYILKGGSQPKPTSPGLKTDTFRIPSPRWGAAVAVVENSCEKAKSFVTLSKEY